MPVLPFAYFRFSKHSQWVSNFHSHRTVIGTRFPWSATRRGRQQAVDFRTLPWDNAMCRDRRGLKPSSPKTSGMDYGSFKQVLPASTLSRQCNLSSLPHGFHTTASPSSQTSNEHMEFKNNSVRLWYHCTGPYKLHNEICASLLMKNHVFIYPQWRYQIVMSG